MAKIVKNQGKDEKEEKEIAPPHAVKESEESQIPEELKPVFADPNIPTAQKKRILNALVSVRTSFSGPVPPPNLLQGYNDVLENGAERIVAMAEKQSTHRMQLEDHAIKEGLKQSRRGQSFGFIIGLVVLLLATLLAYLGHDVVAGIFGGSTIVGLVAVFVIGKKHQEKDLADKQ